MSNFPNAKKDWDADQRFCWAAVASNALTAAGYAEAAGFTDDTLDMENAKTAESKVFQYFKNHFENKGGYPIYGVRWFMTGKYDIPDEWTMDVSRIIEPGGGFFPDISLSGKIRQFPASALRLCKPYFSNKSGACAIKVGIYNTNNNQLLQNHALSLYSVGHEDEDGQEYDENDPRYYNIITCCNPDVVDEGVKFFRIFYDTKTRKYLFLDEPWKIHHILFLDSLIEKHEASFH
ncbi:MAG: hypothetical protein IJJ20_08190 [Thermoguttaceae bacterium]|nr:hypothetical protein [Thermoguttaceae bacterium]